ncbi:MAG: DUF366 family protein [Candidatus Heimdallarchaeota archaeon]|nr:DUF366 family protein [Candidatus Heimdallarchaeota archaeon]
MIKVKIQNKYNYSIVIEDLSKLTTYDGSQLSSQFTSQNYDVIGNSILVFRGGMKLSPKEMVDIKDIQRESHLSNILISSDDSLHFIIEEFDIQPPNMEIEYYRLRMLTQIVIELLNSRGITTNRKGTDIYIQDKKVNVGIASISVSSSKIHFGINLGDTGFPKHVKATCLFNLGVQEEEIADIITQITERYINGIQKIKEDVAKTKYIQ